MQCISGDVRFIGVDPKDLSGTLKLIQNQRVHTSVSSETIHKQFIEFCHVWFWFCCTLTQQRQVNWLKDCGASAMKVLLHERGGYMEGGHMEQRLNRAEATSLLKTSESVRS